MNSILTTILWYWTMSISSHFTCSHVYNINRQPKRDNLNCCVDYCINFESDSRELDSARMFQYYECVTPSVTYSIEDQSNLDILHILQIFSCQLRTIRSIYSRLLQN
jgi:hypothetical protein